MRPIALVALAIVVVMAGVGLVFLLSRAPVEEGRCQLRYRAVNSPDELSALAFQFLSVLPAKPAQVRDLPPGFEESRFYELEVAGGRAIVCLARSHRLCVDSNRDGVLSDERVFRGTRVKSRGNALSEWKYGPISLGAGDAGDAQKPAFYIVSTREDIAIPLRVYPACIRTGRLRVDGRICKVAVVDGDYDGRFASVVSLPIKAAWRRPDSDIFAIDHDGDGKFKLSLFQRSDVMPLSRMVLLNSTYYAIDLAEDGSALALRVVEPQMGELALECPNSEFECKLWSDAAEQCLVFPYIPRSYRLPTGTYAVIEGVLRIKDTNGKERILVCDHRTGGLRSFEIKAGATTTLKIGAPFTVSAAVSPRGTDQVVISPVLKGCAGEVYFIRHVGPVRSGMLPTLRILDEQGNVLHSGQFAYG